MKIKRFTSIKKFKSFTDFDWTKFCRFVGKDANGVEQMQVEELGHVSTIFGENGSGKSTLCGVLKSLSQHEEFETTLPEIAEVEVKKNGSTTVHKFESGHWVNGRLDKGDILFFDVDFINGNVHTNGGRGNREGQHSQSAGQLIIDLDAEAHRLKAVKDYGDGEVANFRKANDRALKLEPTDADRGHFARFASMDAASIVAVADEAKKVATEANAKLTTLRKFEKKQVDISGIVEVVALPTPVAVPDLGICKELFKREVKERAQEGADIEVKAHFEKHRSLIEFAKDSIPTDYHSFNCPLACSLLRMQRE